MEIAETPRERRMLLIIVAVVFLALAAIRIAAGWINKSADDTAASVAYDAVISVTDNLLAALIAVGVTLTLLALLSPRRQWLASVGLGDPTQTNSDHLEVLTKTKSWCHVGHYGGWVRGKVMPALAEAGGRNPCEIRMVVLDPADRNTCDRFTRFRNSERITNIEGAWTEQRTYCEIYATIYAAQMRNAENNKLSVQVFLHKSFSVFRYDINDSWAAITRIDPREPPIIVRPHSSWYQALLEDMKRQAENARAVPFLAATELQAIGEIKSLDQFSALMTKLGAPLPNHLAQEQLEDIAKQALAQWNQAPKRYN